jgi:hypothetical protein
LREESNKVQSYQEQNNNYLVGPTGLKPVPSGLKVRCSVTRAPGQDIADCQLVFRGRVNAQTVANWKSAIGSDLAVAEGFEPSHGRINSAVPYQLGYATESKDEGRKDEG